MAINTTFNATIVQLCLPHYRVPFFATLSSRLSSHCQVVAGPYSRTGSPVSVREAPGVHWTKVQNIFIRRRLAIQHPLPPAIFSSNVTVLEFNPRILTNIGILIRRRQLGHPTILWGHGLSPRTDSPRWIKALRRWMAHIADALIFYSNQGRQDFITLGLPPQKLFVAHNAIDVDAIKIAQERNTHPTYVQPNHLLYVGRLISAKKPGLLVDAFIQAVNDLPSSTNLIIVGDGPERSRLEVQAMAAGLSSRVVFAGEVTDESELAPYFTQSILSISPGYVGLSAIHSLAYALPMLVADREPHSPEIEAISEGHSCEFFESDNATALANRLVSLVGQPERLRIMGQNGLADVTRSYSLQHMAETFVRAFAYVLA